MSCIVSCKCKIVIVVCVKLLVSAKLLLKLVFSFGFSHQIFPLIGFFFFAGFFPEGCRLSP